MGAGQFLRDFRRDYHVKKSLAHRKALMVRKEKMRKRQMKVNLANISQDKSPGKKVSHTKLVALVDELNVQGLVSLYKKKELQFLCNAYACRFLSKWNKKELASSLFEAIHRHNYIPCQLFCPCRCRCGRPKPSTCVTVTSTLITLSIN
jgi:hypothetical protein